MTAQERFEEAMRDLLASWREGFPREYQEAVRSTHAACVEEARVKGEAAGRVDSASRIVQAAEDTYERGLREGAERLRHRIASKLVDLDQNDKLNRADVLGIVDECWARSKCEALDEP